MKTRLERYAAEVGLQHGAALASLYYQLLDAHRPGEALIQARAALNAARLLRPPVRVFSPYHLLRAAYQMKGFEALLADCRDAALVVDEIHAYAPERLACILALLALLRDRFGLRLFIMTATLPPVAAHAVHAALGDLPLIRADAATYAAFTRHRLDVRPGDLMEALPEIAAAARERAPLVTVNTVRRARQAAAGLRALGCEVLLLHGRFNARDRRRHESELFARFGGPRAAPPYPVVVATQVIEVSVDISLDLLYSDPAPLDALLQRFGRINRRREHAPCPVTVFDEPTGAGERATVYDPALVARSVDVLRARSGQVVDESAVGDWLAEAYADSGDWQARYDEARAAFQRHVIDPLHPFESADAGLVALFRALIDECAVLPTDLEDEYQALLPDNPVEAAALMVALRWQQYKMLERRGEAWTGDEPGLFYTSAAYDPESGLKLEVDDGD
jgi:CRISPR-associated endonuclease/helicase Cas3